VSTAKPKKKGGTRGRERVRGGYAGHFGGAKAKKARDLRSGGEGILAHYLTDRMEQSAKPLSCTSEYCQASSTAESLGTPYKRTRVRTFWSKDMFVHFLTIFGAHHIYIFYMYMYTDTYLPRSFHILQLDPADRL
jgi:hypothetical protein